MPKKPMNFVGAFFVTLLLGAPFFVGAQPDECQNFSDPKAEKLLGKAMDSGKYGMEKRIQFLETALELDPACYACAQELGHLMFTLFKRNSASGLDVEGALLPLVEKCPTFHAEPWYELGAVAYAQGDYPLAMTRFDKFLEFSADGNRGKRYNRQAEEVQDVLDDLTFQLNFYAHEHDVELVPLTEVNTTSDEYLPALSPDGSLLFLTHAERVKPKGDVVSRVEERFQWAKRPADQDKFNSPENLPSPFNDGTRYGGASISVDNRELFIAASNPLPNYPENIDLFLVNYEVLGQRESGGFNYRWGSMECLSNAINSPDGWEAQPALSSNGTELFFSAVKSNSTPDADNNPTMDLMFSVRNAAGEWDEAQPIASLNTSSNEKSPFLHPDGRTLYFSSDRSPGGGGYDIWYSRRDEQGEWGAPINIGAPINTTGDEHGLVVAADGKQAYLGSRRQGTKGLDILSLPLPPPHRASEITIIRGSILNEAGAPDTTVQVAIQRMSTMEMEYLEVNQDDGTFARALEIGAMEEVVLLTEGPNTAFDAIVLPKKDSTTPVTSAAAANLELKAREIALDEPYEMRDIRYATSSSEIDPESCILLRSFANYLGRHPEYRIVIQGHTDNVGSSELNQVLSEERAAAVQAYLVEYGVPKEKVESVGFGSNRPISPNDTESGRAANRRTEFVMKN